VFLLLGLQLPGILADVWNDPTYTHFFLVLCAVLVTLILLAVRFLSLAVFAIDVVGDTIRVKLKNTLLLTLSGVKGTVSLATAFALPMTYGGGLYFAHRPLLLFITAGAIILSLLVALILLPVIADSAKRDGSGSSVQIRILREVIAQLKEQARGKTGDRGEAAFVIRNYKERVREMEDAEYDRREKRAIRSLWRFMYRTECETAAACFERGETDAALHRDIRDMLFSIYSDRLRGAAAHAMLSFLFLRLSGGRKRLHRLLDGAYRAAITERLAESGELLTDALHDNRETWPERLTHRILHERKAKAAEIEERMRGRALAGRLQPGYEGELINGFYVERRVIHQFLDRGEITDEQANTLRGDVNRLELYALSEGHGETAPMVKAFTKLRDKMHGPGPGKKP
jgi:CPA1 family monovalent cation:H+ antiporter